MAPEAGGDKHGRCASFTDAPHQCTHTVVFDPNVSMLGYMKNNEWIKIEVREYVELHKAHVLHPTTDTKDVRVMSSDTGPVVKVTHLTQKYPVYFKHVELFDDLEEQK